MKTNLYAVNEIAKLKKKKLKTLFFFFFFTFRPPLCKKLELYEAHNVALLLASMREYKVAITLYSLGPTCD